MVGVPLIRPIEMLGRSLNVVFRQVSFADCSRNLAICVVRSLGSPSPLTFCRKSRSPLGMSQDFVPVGPAFDFCDP